MDSLDLQVIPPPPFVSDKTYPLPRPALTKLTLTNATLTNVTIRLVEPLLALQQRIQV